MLVEAFSIAASGLEIVSSFLNLHPPGPDDRDQSKKVVKALRAIYFVPNGVRVAFENLAAGRELSENDLQQIERFEEADVRVNEAIGALDFDRIFRLSVFSLRAANEMHLIQRHKIDLRRKIATSLRAHIAGRAQISREEAGRFVGLIEELNRLIEEMETRLRASPTPP